MSTPVKLSGFVALLLAAFGLAWGAGSLAGPVGAAAEPAAHDDSQAAGDHGDGGHETDTSETADHLPGGLMVAQDGYAIALTEPIVPAQTHAVLTFRINGADGEPVTQYETSHEKDLHLIVVRRDMARFQHVHPTLAPDGTWSVPLDLSAPGAYRVFADFVPRGHDGVVLGADLAVAGEFQPIPVPSPAPSTEVDGYTVTLDGHLHAGETTPLTFSVTKDGAPVTDLEPYLGAYGHLVALRDGDLAYLHVHPEGHPGDGATTSGPRVAFSATAPSAGTYRLFLDFQHDGVVRTAELTLEVAP